MISVVRTGMVSCALTKRVPTSDLAAEAIILLRVWQTVWTGPFSGI